MSLIQRAGWLLLAGLMVCSPALADTDCPADFAGFQAIQINSQSRTARPDGFGALRFVAARQLTSDAKRFGGLSGIDLLCDNKFVLISDRGNLLTLAFSDELSLANTAMIAPLRDAQGQVLAQKNGGKKSDSESMDWDGQTLLVSFEQQHRILSFDLAKDGANAQGQLLARVSGLAGRANRGMESLARATDGQRIMALERNQDGTAPLAITNKTGEIDFSSLQFPLQGRTLLSGFDVLPASKLQPQLLFSLHRDWSHEVKGRNTIRIAVTKLVSGEGGTLSLGKTKLLSTFHQAVVGVPGNNFEGIAVRQLPNGDARLYLITDNNFDVSGRQVTLLLALDVPKDQLSDFE
ncbi:hypothetical protein MNBD_ALPHA06-2030 [hydrothermal vent metagenome]|uniref:Phytase-like domain-containing protein n=1 Tax=hydrothermal vent metagenome TaxID=652676 RepID=A0A3B0R8E2_9ZZZZ